MKIQIKIPSVLLVIIIAFSFSTGCEKKKLPSAENSIEGALRQYHCSDSNFIIEKTVEVISRVDRPEHVSYLRENEDKTDDKRFRNHYTYCMENLKIEVLGEKTISDLGVKVVQYRMAPEQILRFFTEFFSGEEKILVELRTDPELFFKRQDEGRVGIEGKLASGALEPATTTTEATIVEEDGQWRVYLEKKSIRAMMETARLISSAVKLSDAGKVSEGISDLKKAFNIVAALKFITPKLEDRRERYYYSMLQYAEAFAEKRNLKFEQLGIKVDRPFLRIAPVVIDEQLYGYIIRRLSPTAELVGLKEGDVIQKINELVPATKLTDPMEEFIQNLCAAETIIVNRGITAAELYTIKLPKPYDIRY